MLDKLRETSLDQIKPGERAVVNCVCNKDTPLCCRLLALGIVKGSVIEVLSAAPFGGPLEIKARGVHLSVRRDEAAKIEVSPWTQP